MQLFFIGFSNAQAHKMTSFEIECPPSFHDCHRLDVYPEHKSLHSEFHLMHEGQFLSVIQRNEIGQWCNSRGKPLTVEELAFVSSEIENNRG